MSEEKLGAASAAVAAPPAEGGLLEALASPDLDMVGFFELRRRVFEVPRNLNRYRELLNGWEAFSAAQASPTVAAVKQGVGWWFVGDVRRASAILERVPTHRVGGYALACCRMEEGDAGGALEVLDALLSQEPAQAAYLTARVDALVVLAREAEADKAIDALSACDDPSEHLYQVGARHERNGDHAEAMESYEQALAANPRHSRALFRLARQNDRAGNDEAAIDCYERLRRVGPTYVQALINLGILYEDRGNWDRAEECYGTVLRYYPNHGRARLYLHDVQESRVMYYDRDQERRVDKRNQILRIPVTDFELSVRSRNCLNKMNINCLGDLIQKTEIELLSYKNFGETSLNEIKEMLAQKGLRLGMGLEEQAQIGTSRHSPAPAAPSQDVLQRPLSEFEFSVRSRKCMERLGLVTVGDLCARTEQDLLAAKNFGQTSLNEIRKFLGEFNYNLRDLRE
ncbi:MAG: tetratricopeptide repeat protein [Planctomycetes bacterium]|nr:tetratricopeptide repeat protein [Planctomycetota bacterium]